MKPYISELETNKEVISYFLIAEAPQVRKSKKNTDYLCVKLIDKTGDIDGRLWEIPRDLDPNTLKKVIVKVKGMVTEWNEQKQLTINQIRAASEGDEVDLGDFFERSPIDPERMWSDLLELLDAHMLSDDLSRLLKWVLSTHETQIKAAPAAKSLHHNYIGGLLEHILSLCRLACAVSSTRSDLDVDLLLSACVLHDIGKVWELSYDMGIGYTVEGTLLGHISMGMIEVARAADELDVPASTKMAVLHLIASHHGLLEYGSPKVPLMREAITFHLLDMMDARLFICNALQKKGVEPNGLTKEWSKEIGGPLFSLQEIKNVET